MPAIESINNHITKDDDHSYSITGQVIVGAGIDDVSFAVFNVKNGGRLIFGNNCSTTFTKCTFIEHDNAHAYGIDGYNALTENRNRFGRTNCTAQFLGCTFIQSDGIGRSDWDVPPGSQVKFGRYENDKSRIIIYGTTSQYNHFASEHMEIDGLVIDCRRPGGNLEFIKPPKINGLEVKDNDPGNGNRQIVVLMDKWDNNTTYGIRDLKARNIAPWSWRGQKNPKTKVLELLSLEKDILKSTAGSNNEKTSQMASTLIGRRDYHGSFIDSQQNQLTLKAFVKNTDNDQVYLNDTVNHFALDLESYRQDAGTNDITRENNYQAVFRRKDLNEIVKAFTHTQNTYDSNTLFFKDLNYKGTVADASELTEFSNLQEIYDYTKIYLESNPEVDNFIKVSGVSLDFGGVDVEFSGAAASKVYDYDPSTQKLILKAGSNAIEASPGLGSMVSTGVIIDNAKAIKVPYIDSTADSSFIFSSSISEWEYYGGNEGNFRSRSNPEARGGGTDAGTASLRFNYADLPADKKVYFVLRVGNTFLGKEYVIGGKGIYDVVLEQVDLLSSINSRLSQRELKLV